MRLKDGGNADPSRHPVCQVFVLLPVLTMEAASMRRSLRRIEHEQRHHSAPARRKGTARNRPISSGSVPDHMTLITGVNDLDAQVPSPIWGCDFQFEGGAPGSRAG